MPSERLAIAHVTPYPWGSGAQDVTTYVERVTAELGPYAAPRQLLVLDALPLVGVGKPDRAAVARLAAGG